MTLKNQHVVIVGGGTAGWLTAGVLASRFENKGPNALKVTVIESPNISTVGVGEGTWPSMRSTLQAMGISETEFIRECNVTLKQGSRFDGWKHSDADYYYHPYSLPASYSDLNLAPHWLDLAESTTFAESVSQQAKICDLGLSPKMITTPEYAFNLNYGYHLDAVKFANFLKKHCIDNLGVLHEFAHVCNVLEQENGDIASVITDDGVHYSGDLFIDCTGFTALLIGQHYHVETRCLKPFLFNDSAVTLQVPHSNSDQAIASCTISTAQAAGWIWDIGLQTRRGVGYVYASEFLSDEEAADALKIYVGNQDMGALEASNTPKQLRFSPGYREKFWHKNCVAIGLSAGFVEPLEATAIALIELSAKMVADSLPINSESTEIAAKKFNETFNYRWEKIVDFLKLHYILNQHENSYWSQHRNLATVPESLQQSLIWWRSNPPWHSDTPRIDEMFPSASYQYVLYGMGYASQCGGLTIRGQADVKARVHELLLENSKRADNLAKIMPSNRDLIERIHKFGLQKI